MSRNADVLIIGAGSSGSAVAYYLAKNGVKNIVVLEKLGPGSGATGHAAGLIRHHYMEKPIVEMVRYCARKFQNFEEEMGYSIDYVHNEFIYLTSDKATGIEDVIAMQQGCGVNVEMLKPEEVAHIHPKGEINVEGVGWGLLDHDAGYADPYKVAVGYCEMAKKLGVEILIGETVVGIEKEGNKVTKVITKNEEYSAGLVINAAGLGAAAINEMLGIQVPLKNFSLGHGVLIPDIPFEPDIITINDASVEEFLFFCRPESGGTCLVGMDQDAPDRECNPDTYYMDVPFKKMGRYWAHLMKRMPFLGNFRVSTAFGGLDVKTPDWNPGIGFMEGAPDNYYQIVGGSGHAFKLAPVIGKVVSQELLGEEPSYDFSVFDINRLKAFGAEDFSGSFFINE